MAVKEKKEKNLFLMLIVAGILIILYGGYIVYNEISSYFWPSCEGKIISSEVKMVRSSRRVGEKTVGTGYTPEITYKYEINGIRYYGKNVFFSQYTSGFKSEIQKIVDKYPPGKIVKVYYDPKNPDKSIIEKGFHFSSFMLIFLGLIFEVVGIIIYKYPELLNQKPEIVKREELKM